MAPTARYDVAIDWYEEHRSALAEHEGGAPAAVARRGAGSRCLDAGCGTGVALAFLQSLGWTPVGVGESEAALARARDRGGDVALGRPAQPPVPGRELRRRRLHLDAHRRGRLRRRSSRAGTRATAGQPARLSRRTSLFHRASLALRRRRGSADAVRRVQAARPLHGRGRALQPGGSARTGGRRPRAARRFLSAFVAAGLVLEHFEELALGENEYPYMVALRWRRPT